MRSQHPRTKVCLQEQLSVRLNVVVIEFLIHKILHALSHFELSHALRTRNCRE